MGSVNQEDFDFRCAAQNNLCAICGQDEKERGAGGGSKVLSLDHDHSDGALRGILCSKCNKRLGHFDADPENLVRAYRYMRAHYQKLPHESNVT